MKDGRTAPVFNDKHLSWKWAWAKEMVEVARAMKFPFMAGSSLPVTWRMPAIDMPHDAEVDEVLGIAIGGIDSYDFSATRAPLQPNSFMKPAPGSSPSATRTAASYAKTESTSMPLPNKRNPAAASSARPKPKPLPIPNC